MRIKVIAKTVPANNTIENHKEMFENFGGKAAGVCYMKENFDTIATEDKSATDKRIVFTKESGHHSVYDHSYVSLCMEETPKLLAMVLNNEKMYTTSEKSARYTKMKPTAHEQALYDKWTKIFLGVIEKKYSKEPYVMKAKEKLAQENARYLISVMTPTTMIHTVSYRQLNILYDFAKKMQADNHPISLLLKNSLTKFCSELDRTGLIDEKLVNNGKNKTFSLVEADSTRPEIFSDVYSTNYKGSFAQLAQAHRHRTLNYSFSLLEKPEFYVPEIIRSAETLVNDWLADIESVKDNYPQGTLLNISERGTIENFILKTKERACTRAQLEISKQTAETLKKYCTLGDDRIKNILKDYSGMRCTFKDFKCKEPCAFPDGIKGTREV